MTAKKTKRGVTTGDGQVILFEDGEGSAGEDDLMRVMAELGESGGGSVKVERLREGRRPEYVDEFDVSGFSLKLLRDQHGGGEYRITVKNSNKQYAGSQTVAIAASGSASRVSLCAGVVVHTKP